MSKGSHAVSQYEWTVQPDDKKRLFTEEWGISHGLADRGISGDMETSKMEELYQRTTSLINRMIPEDWDLGSVQIKKGQQACYTPAGPF